MKIPDEILEKWKGLKRYGDVRALAAKLEKSDPIIFDAFKDGECSEEVFEGISEFYKERENLHKQLLKKA